MSVRSAQGVSWAGAADRGTRCSSWKTSVRLSLETSALVCASLVSCSLEDELGDLNKSVQGKQDCGPHTCLSRVMPHSTSFEVHTLLFKSVQHAEYTLSNLVIFDDIAETHGNKPRTEIESTVC